MRDATKIDNRQPRIQLLCLKRVTNLTKIDLVQLFKAYKNNKKQKQQRIIQIYKHVILKAGVVSGIVRTLFTNP